MRQQDAKYLADRLTYANTSTDVDALVAGVRAIAAELESARYDGPGVDVETIMTDLLGALGDIRDALEVRNEGADDAIVAIVPLPAPLVGGEEAIVAWAFTGSGDTLPVVTSADDPTPRVNRHARPTLRQAQ